jgi:hypothetical protein
MQLTRGASSSAFLNAETRPFPRQVKHFFQDLRPVGAVAGTLPRPPQRVQASSSRIAAA